MAMSIQRLVGGFEAPCRPLGGSSGKDGPANALKLATPNRLLRAIQALSQRDIPFARSERSHRTNSSRSRRSVHYRNDDTTPRERPTPDRRP
jgi:hypothetical protein